MVENKKVALFIDAENVSADFAEKIMEKVSDYGEVIIKRIFADWSNTKVKCWNKYVTKFSLKEQQKTSLKSGKNSSDILLIIDAMIILFERDIDVFCLASSDSDFTSLVQELREREKMVVGFGENKKLNKEFVNAFSEFIYLDEKAVKEPEPAEDNKPNKKLKPVSFLEKDKKDALVSILNKLIDAKGKAYLAQIGTDMKNKFPDFIPTNYGVNTMKEFMKKFVKENKSFEMLSEPDNKNSWYVTSKNIK